MGWMPVGQNLEMGFILNQVGVNQYDVLIQVAVDVQGHYTNPQSVAESSLLIYLDPGVTF
jgi:hypothetical protein